MRKNTDNTKTKKKLLKKIKLKPLKDTELLIVTVGDLKRNILPTKEMLIDINTMIKNAMSGGGNGIVLVPPFVKFKKIKFKGSGKDGKTEKLGDKRRGKDSDKQTG